MIGKGFEFIFPSPGSRFHNGGRIANFFNPGPFSKHSSLTRLLERRLIMIL
jgi:hypothetical protein